MAEHSEEVYIKHILEAISDIEESVGNISQEHFFTNKDIRDANIRRLEIIGETTKNISASFKENHPEVPWRRISGLRDKVIHNYFGINESIIWKTIKEDIPDLKKKLKVIKL